MNQKSVFENLFFLKIPLFKIIVHCVKPNINVLQKTNPKFALQHIFVYLKSPPPPPVFHSLIPLWMNERAQNDV